MRPSHILFFDSECLMCNAFIKWVDEQDKKDTMRYSNFDSAIARELELKLSDNTMVLYSLGQKYDRSDAFIEVLRCLEFPLWGIKILKLIPPSIRNFIYNFVAKYRYIFNASKKDVCCSLDLNKKILK